jgi:hypothetical protein
MFMNKLKKVLGSVFSSILLCVTFGVYSTSKADANANVPTNSATKVESGDRELLESLKRKVQADYRANIDDFMASGHPGGGGGINM